MPSFSASSQLHHTHCGRSGLRLKMYHLCVPTPGFIFCLWRVKPRTQFLETRTEDICRQGLSITVHILLKCSCPLRGLISTCVTSGATLKGLGEQPLCKVKGLTGWQRLTLLVVGTSHDLECNKLSESWGQGCVYVGGW